MVLGNQLILRVDKKQEAAEAAFLTSSAVYWLWSQDRGVARATGGHFSQHRSCLPLISLCLELSR